MNPMSDFAEYVKLAEQEAERAHRQVDLARQQLEQAERARRLWKDLLASLRRGHFAHGLLLLRREAELIRELEATDGGAIQMLRELHHQLQQHARSSVVSVAREFPAAARDVGIRIDSTSRHPVYTFNKGFLRLEMDERKVTAKVVPRDGNDVVVGLDLGLVVETIRSEQTRLFERKIDAQSFLGSLHRAYAAVLRTEGRSDGDELPLRRVTNRLAKNLNRFAADEFNVDLSRLVRRGDLVVAGKTCALEPHSRPTAGHVTQWTRVWGLRRFH